MEKWPARAIERGATLPDTGLTERATPNGGMGDTRTCREACREACRQACREAPACPGGADAGMNRRRGSRIAATAAVVVLPGSVAGLVLGHDSFPFAVLLGCAVVSLAVAAAPTRRRRDGSAVVLDRDRYVLSAVAMKLAADLDLAAVGVWRVEDDGRFTETFATGHGALRAPCPERPVDPTAVPERLGPGEEALVPLQRSGRVLGALGVRPRAAMGRAEMATVRAVGDVLAGAIAEAQIEEREQEVARRLEEVDLLKTEFLTTASHVLRTPLTAIVGFGSVLETSYDRLSDDQRREFIGRIAHNATALAQLVDDLLDFSRLERHACGVQLHTVDLSAALAELVEKLGDVLGAHHVDLRVTPGVTASTDRSVFERVVSNLLSNAAKFSPPASTIGVGLERHGDHAVVTVDDEGPGVPPDERPHVFSRFYRGHSDAALRTRGAGIGLSVVKRLVEDLHGAVSVGTSPGGGARFAVMLPIHRPVEHRSALGIAGAPSRTGAQAVEA